MAEYGYRYLPQNDDAGSMIFTDPHINPLLPQYPAL